MADIFDLIYGPPGSGKTLMLIALAKNIYQKTGKQTRVYTGDGSYSMYKNSGLVDGGIIASLMDFTARDYPFSVLQQITEGMIPVDLDDPKSKFRTLTKEEVNNTGLWIFEGLSVAGNYMMGDAKGGLAQRAADGEVIGQDIAARFTDGNDKDKILDKDGNPYKYGGNSGGHYAFGQRHLLANIVRSKSLPRQVVWTAHERYDDGERGGSFSKGQTADKYKLEDKIIGPECIGKQMTANISREFGNTLHTTVASKKSQEGDDKTTGKGKYVEKAEYRLYTRDHYDPDGIVTMKYRAVNRVANEEKVNMIKDYYTGEKPGQALLAFYKDLAEANTL
jgi:DNA polymerase III delta prime subunit